MSLRKTKQETAAKATKTAQGSGWTGGRALGQKAVTGALLVAVACGPLALVSAVGNAQAKPAVAQVAVEEPLTANQQAAGEYGASFVAAWLSATRDDVENLKTYINPAAVGQLSPTAWKYRDLSVVSVAKTSSANLFSVVVAANVEEFDLDNENGGTIWPRRYFAVTVRATENKLTVIGLPSPIAAPEKDSTAVRLVYSQDVGASTSARETVEAFLNAYLVGSGDVSRVITPGSAITAITPAPFMTLSVKDVKSDLEPSDDPRTGDVLHVLTTVEAASAGEQRLTMTYALTLTARDGRWETTSVDLVPLEYVRPGTDSAPDESR